MRTASLALPRRALAQALSQALPLSTLSPARTVGIGLLGVCEDRNSSYMQGPASAPPIIRQTLHNDSSNSYSELGIDVLSSIKDYGNIQAPQPDWRSIYSQAKPLLEQVVEDNRVPLTLGGDHSVSYPLIRAMSEIHQRPLVVVHFDAHPDLYPNFEGNESSHASPFARVLEISGLCQQLISIGIRTANPVQREQMKKFGVKVVEARRFPPQGADLRSFLNPLISPQTKVYLSIDLDVLEPVRLVGA
jgi:arginase